MAVAAPTAAGAFDGTDRFLAFQVGADPEMTPRLRVASVPFAFRAGNITHTYPANTPMYVKDIMVLRLIQENFGRRPIYFALTAGNANRMGLDRYVTQEGLAFKLHNDVVQSGPGVAQGLFGTLVDVERTRRLTWDVYRYARLFQADSLRLDPTDDNIAGNLAFVFMTLGDAYRQQGNLEQMMANYQKAAHLSPNPELLRIVRQLQGATLAPELPGGDSAAREGGGGEGARDSAKR